MLATNSGLEQALGGARVIPLLTVDHPRDTVPVARALLAGGLAVVEVALRTGGAMAAIGAIAEQVHGMTVGAGTVLDASAVREAKDAGAAFIVSPGLSAEVVAASADAGLPCLPGVTTATEVMRAHGMGLELLKFFPAEAAGGIGLLKALGGPFPHVRFCPTGGVTQANAADYLSLPNVFAVGGSWLTPRAAVSANEWDHVTALARDAARL